MFGKQYKYHVEGFPSFSCPNPKIWGAGLAILTEDNLLYLQTRRLLHVQTRHLLLPRHPNSIVKRAAAQL